MRLIIAQRPRFTETKNMKPQGAFKPMLAASKPRDYTIEQFYDRIHFPVIATPKLDGIRCVTRDVPRPHGYKSEAFSRSLKPIPNVHIATQIGIHCPSGLDGEIMTYSNDLFDQELKLRNFNDISSDVMCFKGSPNFKYHIFDYHVEHAPQVMYKDRIHILETIVYPTLPSWCVTVPTRTITSLSQLIEYEAEQVANGFEGICFRDPHSPYKYGRSTLREGWLVKMKRFVTEEAVVVGFEEEMANNNPQVTGTTGYAERSSHQANLVGKGRLGALVVELNGNQFRIGTGFTAIQRQNMWDARESLIGRLVTFKHMPYGAKDVPRIPVFVGFRHPHDL